MYLRTTIFSLILAIALLSSMQALGEGIHIVFTGQAADGDRVGDNLIYTIKDKLRGSNSFTLITEEPDTLVLELRFVTVAVSEYSTAYSAVFTRSSKSIDFYLANIVGVCGEQRVDSQALSIVKSADDIAENLGLRK